MDSRSSTRLQVCGLSFALVLITLVCYWPVRLNDFVNYDDQQYVYENNQVRKGLTWETFLWAFQTGHASNWHPLTWLSHMLDVRLFGLNPAGHHLTNVLWHAANAVLLFLLFYTLTGFVWRSGFVAALFAVHPLHVESVAWISERKDVLSTFFGLLALLAYVRFAKKTGFRSPATGTSKGHGDRQSPAKEKTSANLNGMGWPFRDGFYWAALCLFSLSLMSKPMLVTLPFILLLLDFWPLGRLQAGPLMPKAVARLVIEKAPFFVLSIASSAVTLVVQEKAMVFYAALPLPDRLANALVSYARYLLKTIWPSELAIFYPHPGSWPAAQIAAAAGLIALITVVALWAWRRRPYLGAGWLWFLGTLVPVIGLVQVGVQAMADRYTYFPLIGIFIMAGWSLSELATRGTALKWTITLLALTAIGACAVLTQKQVRFWRNTQTLFEHNLRVAPNSWVAHLNIALHALSRYQQAARGSIETQVLQPAVGSAQSGPDYLQEVISHAKAALAVKPHLADAHLALAKALTERGELDAARVHVENAIRANPKNAQARQTLAEILHRKGLAAEAVAAYRATLALEPDWEAVLNNLAWLLATHPDGSVRNGSEAVALASRACELTQHTNLWYFHTLAAAYAEQGNFSNAVVAAETAARLARASGNPQLLEKAVSREELYRSGRPLREP